MTLERLEPSIKSLTPSSGPSKVRTNVIVDIDGFGEVTSSDDVVAIFGSYVLPTSSIIIIFSSTMSTRLRVTTPLEMVNPTVGATVDVVFFRRSVAKKVAVTSTFVFFVDKRINVDAVSAVCCQ